jgi:tagatose 1,6-diphosphate aldolase
MIYLRSDVAAANVANMAALSALIADFAAEDLLLVVEFLTYALPGETPADLAARTPGLIEGGSRLASTRGPRC